MTDEDKKPISLAAANYAFQIAFGAFVLECAQALRIVQFMNWLARAIEKVSG